MTHNEGRQPRSGNPPIHLMDEKVTNLVKEVQDLKQEAFDPVDEATIHTRISVYKTLRESILTSSRSLESALQRVGSSEEARQALQRRWDTLKLIRDEIADLNRDLNNLGLETETNTDPADHQR